MSDGLIAETVVPIFATGVLAYEGEHLLSAEEKKKKGARKKAHLEKNRSKGRHKLKEVV